MPNVDDVLDALIEEEAQDEPTTEYVCFLLPPEPENPDEIQLAVEFKDVFYHDDFHSVTYSGLEWYEFGGSRKFNLTQDMENVFSPMPGHTMEECLALIEADPYFTVVPTPPGDHGM